MIGRLLGPLVTAVHPGELDVIVVANGCTDDTAQVAASFGPPVRVVSIPVASKRAALVAGDEAARDFPRMYVDADVELGADDVRALGDVLRRPGALAAGPQRVLALTGSSWLVRWYYDVWLRLPEVRSGLFGRGVIGLSEAGHARVARLPPLLADDLAASLVFGPDERVIVPGARVAGLAGPGAGHLDGDRGGGVAVLAVDDPGEVLLRPHGARLGGACLQPHGNDGHGGQAQHS